MTEENEQHMVLDLAPAQILAAAKAILASGVQPSGRRVYRELNGRVSYRKVREELRRLVVAGEIPVSDRGHRWSMFEEPIDEWDVPDWVAVDRLVRMTDAEIDPVGHERRIQGHIARVEREMAALPPEEREIEMSEEAKAKISATKKRQMRRNQDVAIRKRGGPAA